MSTLRIKYFTGEFAGEEDEEELHVARKESGAGIIS